jgi:hypothetical protein
MGPRSLLNAKVVLTDWEHTTERLPHCVEGIIAGDRGKDTYVVALTEPVEVSGKIEARVVVSGRHSGFPVTRVFPVFPMGLLIFRHPLSRLFAPLVAVNVETECGHFFAVACMYLKSVYLKAGGKVVPRTQ